MLTTRSCDVREKPSHARWTHIERTNGEAKKPSAGIEVLDVDVTNTREWAFVWRGRAVLQPLSSGIDGAGVGPLAPGAVIVVGAGAAPIRIHARIGSAFRVMFEEPSAFTSDVSRFRIDAPRVVMATGASPGVLFEAAMEAVRAATPVSPRMSPALAHARRYIEDHLEEDFDLETLSRAVGTGRCHLCRSFRRVFGMPPYRYRAHLRLARARELLMDGLGCSDVAFAVGFCDQSHLSRFFKELTGTTPGAYARILARAPSSRSALAA